MQADAGNVNQVMDQVSQKIKKLSETANAKTGGASPFTAPAGAESGWAKLQGALGGAGGKWAELGTAVGGVGGKFALVGLAATAAVAAISAVAMAIPTFVALNSEIENTQMRFKVLLGDLAKGKAAFAETKQYADTTPYSLKDSAAARSRLLAAGITDKETLTDAGNLAAAGGRQIEEAAGAFARLKSGSTGEAMEALRMMNVSQMDFEAQGITFDKGGQAQATAAKMVEALRSIVRANFGGLTDELGQKWTGLWSTFRDTIDNSMRAVSSGSFVWLKDAVKSATESLNELLNSKGLERFGNGVGAIFGACVAVLKSFSVLLAPIAGMLGGALVTALGLVAAALVPVVFLIQTMANGMKFIGEVGTKGFAEAFKNADARQTKINTDAGKQGKQATAAITGQEYDADADNTEATNKQAKAANDEIKKALELRKAAIALIGVETTAKNAAWEVDKAKGRDAVAIAQEESNAAQKSLKLMQEKEAAVKAAMDAADLNDARKQGVAGAPNTVSESRYKKSKELMDAEVAYAKSLENLYAKAIAKSEAMGEFVTKTSKLIAEAQAIDARGGDSEVKRYEAKKMAMEEYLDTLKKMRDIQEQTATGMAKMQAAASNAQGGNLGQLQNQNSVIDQNAQIFHAQALQERLKQIQQLSQSEGLGARERFALYEQERQVFAELTNSIGNAIEATMSKIEALQSKALGSASSAIGILGKLDASRGDYEDIASGIRGLRLDPKDMNLSQLGQMVGLVSDLKTKGVNARDLMPTTANVVAAFKKEMESSKDTIAQLREGLGSLIALSTQIGAQAAKNFFAPWMAQLAILKSQMASLGGGGGQPAQQAGGQPAQLLGGQPENNASAGTGTATSKKTTDKNAAVSVDAEMAATEFEKTATGNLDSIKRIAAIIRGIKMDWAAGTTEAAKEAWGKEAGSRLGIATKTEPYNDPAITPWWYKAGSPTQLPAGIPTSNTGSGANTTNVNAKTEVKILGSSLKEVQDIVAQAKERFGEELYAALQNANQQYSL